MGGGAHARAAGCSSQNSYKIRNFGHFLVVLAAKLWFHIINFMQVTRKPEIRRAQLPSKISLTG